MGSEVYFDNSATSYPKPSCVIKALTDYMIDIGVSPGRGTYERSRKADRLLYETRKSVAKLLGVTHPAQVIFTNNATEAINLGLKGFIKEGQHILTSMLEHNAVWRPLKKLEQEKGIIIHQVRCSEHGILDLDEAESILKKEKIELCVCIHASNVLGCIFPVKELTHLCHLYETPILVDASQSAGIVDIKIDEWGIDMLAFTGHKGLMGPTGTGGLVLKEGIKLNTLKEGGTGSMSVSPYQPESSPDRYEVGTLNMAGLAGLKSGVDYIMSIGIEQIYEKESKLIQRLISEIDSLSEINIYGPSLTKERLGLLSLNIKDVNPYNLAKKLDCQYGIMARAGMHCAPQAHKCIGTLETGTLRISLGFFNTDEDINYLIDSLKKIIRG